MHGLPADERTHIKTIPDLAEHGLLWRGMPRQVPVHVEQHMQLLFFRNIPEQQGEILSQSGE